MSRYKITLCQGAQRAGAVGFASEVAAPGAAMLISPMLFIFFRIAPWGFAEAFRRHYGVNPTEFRTIGMYSGIGRASGS